MSMRSLTCNVFLKNSIFVFLLTISILYNMKKILVTLAVAISCLLIAGCATVQKIKAGKTLQKVDLALTSTKLDSLKGNQELFEKIGTATKSLLPNPQVVVIVQDLARGVINSVLATAYISVNANATLPEGADTLYVRNVTATLFADSLYELPVSIADSNIIAPGTQQLTFYTEFPIDKRLFNIMDVNELRLKGTISVSFEPTSELISFDFDEKRIVTAEEKKEFVDNTREKVLNALVGDWVNSILPNN